MANRTFKTLYALSNDLVVLEGQITIGGTGAVATQAEARGGFSVARTGAGHYTVTFANKYKTLCFAAGWVIPANALGTNEEFRPVAEDMTAGTVQFKNVDMTTPAAVDPASGDVVKFLFVFRNATSRR